MWLNVFIWKNINWNLVFISSYVKQTISCDFWTQKCNHMINSWMHQNCFQVYLTSVFSPVVNPLPVSHVIPWKDVIDVVAGPVAQTKKCKVIRVSKRYKKPLYNSPITSDLPNSLTFWYAWDFIFENLKSKKQISEQESILVSDWGDMLEVLIFMCCESFTWLIYDSFTAFISYWNIMMIYCWWLVTNDVIMTSLKTL